ncbi:MAG: hypothetical protein U5N86_06850 [Planctomycetota bacterium]|nr:hypothetical protein [Planctomycetota bacterium]
MTEWLGGIDEAGLGALLGPLVHGAVRAPIGWENKFPVREALRDSKLIYSSGRGLARMEAAVVSAARLAGWNGNSLVSLLRFLNCSPLPLAPSCFDLSDLPFPLFCEQLPAPPVLRGFKVHARVTLPASFNAVVSRFNKGQLAMMRLYGLMRLVFDPEESGHLVVDKQGGRNNYISFLFERNGNRLVAPLREGHEVSSYMIGLAQVDFSKGAEELHSEVALASVVAKYVRECYMLRFNEYWTSKVPGLAPTAGYPSDAPRFFNEISEAAAKLGIERETLLRAR